MSTLGSQFLFSLQKILLRQQKQAFLPSMTNHRHVALYDSLGCLSAFIRTFPNRLLKARRRHEMSQQRLHFRYPRCSTINWFVIEEFLNRREVAFVVLKCRRCVNREYDSKRNDAANDIKDIFYCTKMIRCWISFIKGWWFSYAVRLHEMVTGWTKYNSVININFALRWYARPRTHCLNG